MYHLNVSFYETIENKNTFCHLFGSKRTVAIMLKLLYTVTKKQTNQKHILPKELVYKIR